MALYLKFKSKDRSALFDLAETMHKSLKGYGPYIDSDVAIVEGDEGETILCVGDCTAKTDKTILIDNWDCTNN